MKLLLNDNVTTKQDLKAIILEVRKYARWFSQASIKVQVTKQKQADYPPLSPAAVELIEQARGDQPVSQKALDDLLKSLEAYAETTPSITITLAALPPNDLKKTLVTWCRQNINPAVLVDFGFNSTLLGGMVVKHNSHIYDWSFRRQILAARDKFPEVLRRV